MEQFYIIGGGLGKSANINQTELYLKQESMSTQINDKWIIMSNLRDWQALHCKQ